MPRPACLVSLSASVPSSNETFQPAADQTRTRIKNRHRPIGAKESIPLFRIRSLPSIPFYLQTPFLLERRTAEEEDEEDRVREEERRIDEEPQRALHFVRRQSRVLRLLSHVNTLRIHP